MKTLSSIYSYIVSFLNKLIKTATSPSKMLTPMFMTFLVTFAFYPMTLLPLIPASLYLVCNIIVHRKNATNLTHLSSFALIVYTMSVLLIAAFSFSFLQMFLALMVSASVYSAVVAYDSFMSFSADATEEIMDSIFGDQGYKDPLEVN